LEKQNNILSLLGLKQVVRFMEGDDEKIAMIRYESKRMDRIEGT
jgi:hypothetical protein